MKFKDLKNEIIYDIDAGISVELISSPGRGKSEFVRALRDELSARDGEEWGFQTLFLATQQPCDLIGYLFKGEMELEGEKVTITDPSMPLWMRSEDGKPVTHYKRGILFLDEYGQGEGDVKRASAELLLNHKLGPWELPDGWAVVAASNKSTDRSGVTKSFDFVINRRNQYLIDDDVDGWIDWAAENGVTPISMAFAKQNPHIVFADGVPQKQGPWCTPRSLVMADKRLRLKAERSGGVFPEDAISVEATAGLIGDGAAAQLFAFVRLEKEMPPYEKIIKDPEKVKVPEKPDAQMLVTYNLAHRVTVDDIAAVVKYVTRMPKEFAVTFAQAACKRMPRILSTPAMQSWCRENSSLMAAISK